MSFFQVNHKCNGCLACIQNCPAKALDASDERETRTLLHNMTRCARCGTCWRICPHDAIEFHHLLHNRWDQVVTLKLVRCDVCGVTVHTVSLKETLDPKMTEYAVPLCDYHRALSRAGLLTGKQTTKRGQLS